MVRAGLHVCASMTRTSPPPVAVSQRPSELKASLHGGRRLTRFHRLEMDLSVDGSHREVEALQKVHTQEAIDPVLVGERERLDHEARKLGTERMEAADLE